MSKPKANKRLLGKAKKTVSAAQAKANKITKLLNEREAHLKAIAKIDKELEPLCDGTAHSEPQPSVHTSQDNSNYGAADYAMQVLVMAGGWMSAAKIAKAAIKAGWRTASKDPANIMRSALKSRPDWFENDGATPQQWITKAKPEK